MFTGTIKSLDDIPAQDMRRMLPKFQSPNFENNLKLVAEVEAIAKRKNCTPVQIALSWLRCLSGFKKTVPVIIPIPGTMDPEKIKENAKEVELTKGDMEEIERVLEKCGIEGDRYHKAGMELVNG